MVRTSGRIYVVSNRANVIQVVGAKLTHYLQTCIHLSRMWGHPTQSVIRRNTVATISKRARGTALYNVNSAVTQCVSQEMDDRSRIM